MRFGHVSFMCKLSLFVIVLRELFAGSMGWENPRYAEISEEICRGCRSCRERSPTGVTGQTIAADLRKETCSGSSCSQCSSSSRVLLSEAVQLCSPRARGGCRERAWALPTLGTVTAVSVNPGLSGEAVVCRVSQNLNYLWHKSKSTGQSTRDKISNRINLLSLFYEILNLGRAFNERAGWTAELREDRGVGSIAWQCFLCQSSVQWENLSNRAVSQRATCSHVLHSPL